jgi:hypothetical protein
MQLFDELNEENFVLFAARNYYSPRCIDAEEFYEDLNRFTYVKRLLNRYTRGGELGERLILNHITIILNVFGQEAGIKMLEYKTGPHNLHIIKPFLVFINAIRQDQYTGIIMDPEVVDKLRKI